MVSKRYFSGLFLLVLLFVFTQKATASESFITTTDGVKLYVKVKGQGTPLLYLHGGPGSGSFWFEEFFGDFMESQFTVVYLDQRGVGRSSSPANKDFSLERQLKDYEEIREQLGYDSWLTLGHSFGGILQTAYAKAYPKATRGMLMINTTLYLNDSFCNSWSPKAAEFLGETIPDCASDTIPLRERMGIHINKLREKDLFWKMAFAEKKNDSVMNTTYAGFENWNHEYSSVAMDNKEHWKDFRKLATAINVPVLFFYGTKDWMVGPAHYKGIDFPKMLLWKANSGHLPFLEARPELEEAITAYREKFGV